MELLNAEFRFSVGSSMPSSRAMDTAETNLRKGINEYFEAESSEREDGGNSEDLPLKNADPMLGADARALILQLRPTSNSKVHLSEFCFYILLHSLLP